MPDTCGPDIKEMKDKTSVEISSLLVPRALARFDHKLNDKGQSTKWI